MLFIFLFFQKHTKKDLIFLFFWRIIFLFLLFTHINQKEQIQRQKIILHISKKTTGSVRSLWSFLFVSILSKTISRVMSWMIIYLDRLSPDGSSDLPGSRRAALCSLFGLASSGVYMCPLCYQRGGSLLHCLSTLTCQSRRFISVALSLESPPPDVIWHPAL